MFVFSLISEWHSTYDLYIQYKDNKKTYTEELIVEKNNDSESSRLLEQLMWLCRVVRVEE